VLKGSRYEVLWLSGYNSITYILAAISQRFLGGEVLFREEQTLLDPRPLAKLIAKQLMLHALFRQGRALYISNENRRWFQSPRTPSAPRGLKLSPRLDD
jgi:hypothetical protein